MKIRNDWLKRNAGGILREKVWKKGENGRVKKKGWSREGEQGREGAGLGVLGCLMDEGVERLVGAVSPE